jgi:DNA modification methylase
VIIHGDCLEKLREIETSSIQCCVTSPPYWGLRDYGVDGQIGLEETPEAFVQKLVEVFREVRRVLKDDGLLWVNLGDSYVGGQSRGNSPMNLKQASNSASAFQNGRKAIIPEGLKPKDMVGIPWRVAFALQADGWYLRQDIIWHKPNPMPESVQDRCTKSHEYIFLLSKSKKYFFDHKAIVEPTVDKRGPGNKRESKIPNQRLGENSNLTGSLHKIGKREIRNKRSVWTVTTKPFRGAHFATFPPDLIAPCILAGSAKGDTILDPFLGAGTVGVVSEKLGRKWIGIELNANYVEIAKRRVEATA